MLSSNKVLLKQSETSQEVKKTISNTDLCLGAVCVITLTSPAN